MGLPLMPLVANNVVTVENGHPIPLIVLPPRAGVGDCFRKEEHGTGRAIPILRRFRGRKRGFVASAQKQCSTGAFFDRIQFSHDAR